MIKILPMCASPGDQAHTDLPYRTDMLCRVLLVLAVSFALVSATGFVWGVSMLISDAAGGIA